jgi:glucosamine kinase
MLEDTVAVMGLAGANVSRHVEQFSEGLPFKRLRIETDALISVKGALRRQDGIVAAIGTGSVFAVQRGGSIRQVGGWGLVLGDEGSGAWLGRTILARCLKALDGAVPMTPLLAQLLEEHGGGEGIVAFASAATPAEFARLSPRVISSDDPAAFATTDSAISAIAETVSYLQREATLPVVFLGGLGPFYSGRLAGRWPIAEPLGSALDGALLLARGEE